MKVSYDENPDQAEEIYAKSREGVVEGVLRVVQEEILSLKVPHEKADEEDEGKVRDEGEDAVVAFKVKK